MSQWVVSMYALQGRVILTRHLVDGMLHQHPTQPRWVPSHVLLPFVNQCGYTIGAETRQRSVAGCIRFGVAVAVRHIVTFEKGACVGAIGAVRGSEHHEFVAAARGGLRRNGGCSSAQRSERVGHDADDANEHEFVHDSYSLDARRLAIVAS